MLYKFSKASRLYCFSVFLLCYLYHRMSHFALVAMRLKGSTRSFEIVICSFLSNSCSFWVLSSTCEGVTSLRDSNRHFSPSKMILERLTLTHFCSTWAVGLFGVSYPIEFSRWTWSSRLITCASIWLSSSLFWLVIWWSDLICLEKSKLGVCRFFWISSKPKTCSTALFLNFTS